MSVRPQLRPAVSAAREKIAEGRALLKQQHEGGTPGIQVCAQMTDLIDATLQGLYQDALADARNGVEEEIALVAHGGYGRRDTAPYSDVDLMLIYATGAESRVRNLARQLSHNLYDSGLDLGFSTRTVREACGLALKDATIFTTLTESRRLAGSEDLFEKFTTRFRRVAHRKSGWLISAVEEARRDERRKYGETVYLLKPNVKRSRGGLRDLQLLRWIGFARYGHVSTEALRRMGALLDEDFRKLRAAREFLLRLRNELHFHADKSQDLLERSEQVRIAERMGYEGSEALLPVESFMRDYFHHTSEVRTIVANFVAGARRKSALSIVLDPLFSHQVEGDFRVGPYYISATRRGMPKVRGDLAQVLRLMDLANLYDKRIGHATWDAIRGAMLNGASPELSDEAIERFLSILSQPARLGEMLRKLHELRVLERLVPAMKHARGLLQFNEYHKYTVDEHSLRAVDWVTRYLTDDSPVGDAYRNIKKKRTLHLALLLHDLGKGYPEDHSEVGKRLAEETARLFKLSERDSEKLSFLVHRHLSMAHLAFWHDLGDESLVVKFAVDVGSPDVLRMLYVLTCADVAAVGPGVLNDWKLQLLTELYHRAMGHLAGDARATGYEAAIARQKKRLNELVAESADKPWWQRQIAALPAAYLRGAEPEEVVQQLDHVRTLDRREAAAWGRYRPETRAVEYTVGGYEDIGVGIFHRLTGALSCKRMQILSAEIHTLADGCVLDRFYVQDMDFANEPPPERIDEVCRALVLSLRESAESPPKFRAVWGGEGADAAKMFNPLPTRVTVDNSSSDAHSIFSVFAYDRLGLLYDISKRLFDLKLSVNAAKIGTYIDQVVDVFYVTDAGGAKIVDEQRIAEIRRSLLEAIEPERRDG